MTPGQKLLNQIRQSKLITGYYSDFTKPMNVFLICNLLVTLKFEIWPCHSDYLTEICLFEQN